MPPLPRPAAAPASEQLDESDYEAEEDDGEEEPATPLARPPWSPPQTQRQTVARPLPSVGQRPPNFNLLAPGAVAGAGLSTRQGMYAMLLVQSRLSRKFFQNCTVRFCAFMYCIVL